jgi:hypothetical protein
MKRRAATLRVEPARAQASGCNPSRTATWDRSGGLRRRPNVLLASTSMRYTAWITADDQPTLEAWAKALLPHLDAR